MKSLIAPSKKCNRLQNKHADQGALVERYWTEGQLVLTVIPPNEA